MNRFRIHVISTLCLAWLLMSVSAQSLAQGRIGSQYRGSPVYQVEAVSSYEHDPNAYTQGLMIHNGQLYESTGHYGHSSLRHVDLTTGTILKSVELDLKRFGEGITAFNDKIYQMTWRSGEAYVYDLESLKQLSTFYFSGEGWGITHNGSQLITSDGTAEISFRDPNNFRVDRTITVWDREGAVYGLNELEYINGIIYANVFPTDLIARIDPDSGEILSWLYLKDLLDAESPVRKPEILNGIAYDNDSGLLYVTGKYWPKLYQVEIIE